MEIKAIIGLSKNVGKTTFLNRYLNEIKDNNDFLLSSIGWDGELVDHIFGIPKPPIKVYKNNYVATYQKLINNSFKELFLTEVENFFLGKLGVYRCINDDYVQIAGPSSSKEIEIFLNSIIKNNFNIPRLILDGAADSRYIICLLYSFFNFYN
jgi:GTPase SAR1 family protein